MPHMSSYDLESTWPQIQEGIEHILTQLQKGLSYKRYMELYTGIYNYCTSSRARNVDSPTPRAGANLLGAELYRNLKSFLAQHLNKIKEQANSFSDENLLKYYTSQWLQYTIASGYINRVFDYLNRHWVKRERDEGHRDVYDVYTLALVSWKECLFKEIQRNVMSATIQLIERQRNGETIETSLLKGVVESFVCLGLDDNDSSKITLEVYQEYFEKPFIKSTEEYYTNESNRFITENGVMEYMIKVENRLKEEELRLQTYLHESTQKPLIKKCEEVLVSDHMKPLWNKFQELLDNDKITDLSRMYSLLIRVPDGLLPLREQFEAHVKRMGLQSVDEVAMSFVDENGDKSGLNPKAYVDALLTVHRKYSELVTTAFKGDAGFGASLDKACREYVNRNKICSDSSSKSPELLARFCDSLLRKGPKNLSEEEVEDLLTNIMTVFKYVEDKDVFQKFYSKTLAKRLVNGMSASDDSEESMISKLKEACGFEYTSKLQRMFTDMGLSKDLNEAFKDSLNSLHDLPFDFSILVLGTAAWPLQPPSTTFNIPQELVSVYEKFQKFYQTKHNGRKLNWHFHLSKGELKFRASSSKNIYTFQVSTYQMGMLLPFNHKSIYSFEELQSITNLQPDTLIGQLIVLVKSKILLMEEGGEVGSAGSKYMINDDYRSKKLRINLNVPIKSEQKAESEETHKTIEEDRKLLIQAAIVRIMKTRKAMKHVALVQEVISELQSRFKPRVPDIKKCIDILLEKEYIERMEGQKDMLSYIA